MAPVAKPQAIEAVAEPILLEVDETQAHAEHPVVVPRPTPTPVFVPANLPTLPRRSLREVLASFMEQRNIFWGELLGGLLIVGCSIALVISLWTTGKLEKIPFAPFVIFAMITGSLFGIGWYTLRHWKLESTSRGLLVIATLLVPLNFLVIAGLHGQESSGWEIPLEVGAVVVFAWLTSLAGGILFSGQRWLLPLAIVGTGAGQLLFSWLITGERNPSWLLALGIVPVACHVSSCGLMLTRTVRREADRENQSRSLFGFLGVGVFAVMVALGFLVYLAGDRLFGGDISPALGHVALLVALAAWPVLSYGLTVHRALANNPEAGVWRTTGTAVAITGMIIMLGAGVLAWPSPIPLLLVCIFDFAIITYVAFRHELPIAHAAALPCLAVFFLVSFHLTGENLSLDIFGSSSSGMLLAGLFVLLAVAGEVIVRTGRKSHGVCYVLGSGLVAFWSLLLVTFPMRGIENPASALWIYALYGSGSLVINARWRRPMVTSTGLALIVGATLWTLWWRFQQDSAAISVPRWGTVLAIEALAMGGFSALIRWRLASRAALAPGDRKNKPSAFQEPLARSAEATTILAIFAALAGGLLSILRSRGVLSWVPAHIVTAFALMLLYLLLAGTERRKGMARLAGAMLIGGVVAAAGFVMTIHEDQGLVSQLPLLALVIAGAGTLLAAVAIRIRHLVGADADVTQRSVPWYGVLVAWRGPAALAGVLSLAIASISLHPGATVAPIYTALFLATTAFLLAWGLQSRALTWLGSALGLGSIAYAFAHHQAGLGLPMSWQWPLLCHGTIALTISLLLKWRGGWLSTTSQSHKDSQGNPLWHLFAEPLAQSALAFSFPALFVLLVGSETALAGGWGLCWLAGLWLVVAVEKRRRVLFTAFQMVLVVAVMFGVTAWLEARGGAPQFSSLVAGSWDPRIWQAYGIGLAILSLLWMVARLGLESKETAQRLLNPGWPAVDRLVLGALVIGQAVLAVRGILPGIVQELWGVGQVSNFPPQIGGAWFLLGVTALTLLAGLWERRGAVAVIGLTTIAAVIPILAAGQWGMQETAVASALRWTCALAYLAASMLVWSRGALSELATWAGWRIGSSDKLPAIVRRMLLILMAGPVLFLTLLLAVVGFLGVSPGGPADISFFHQLGWVPSAVVPAILVCLTLVGHALRERSPAYVFGAGIVANLTLMGVYALSVVLAGATLDAVAWVRIVQMGTVLAAVWAAAWLLTRAWLLGKEEEKESPLTQPLLSVQLGFGAIGNILLLGAAAFWLCVSAQGANAPRSTVVGEIGAPLGWLALAAAGAAWALRHYQRRTLPFCDFGVLGLAAIVLAACQVEIHSPDLGYRALMIGWAAYPLVWVIFVVLASSLRRHSANSLFLDAAAYWVRLAGILGTVLALNAAFGRGDQLWAGLAVGLISPAAATMAVWRRHEAWAFVSGMGINLATSFIVWHFHANLPLSDWWIALVQANVVAASAVGLLWLAWRQPIELVGWAESPRPTITTASGLMKVGLGDSAHPTRTGIRIPSLLTWQVAISLLGTAALLVVPLVALVLSPADPPLPPEFGAFGSWLALASATAAAAWFLRQFAPARLAHLFGCFGLGLGILAACYISPWDVQGTWLTYHVLTAAWIAHGLVMLIVAVAAFPRMRAESLETRILANAATDRSSNETRSSILDPQSSVFLGWLHAIGLLILSLGLGSSLADPGRLYWSSGPVLAVSFLFGTMAMWQRRPLHVYASGALINVVGSLIWVAGDSHPWEGLAYVNVLSSAVAGGLWSALELWLRKRTPAVDIRGGREPFPHLAVILGLVLCCAMAILVFLSGCLDIPTLASGPLAWTALAALTGATILLLWDASADFPRLGLYVIGLSGILFALAGSRQAPPDLLWSFAVAAAPYILLTVLLARWLPEWDKLRTTLRLPKLPTAWQESWFVPTQLLVSAVVVTLTLWMSVSFDGLAARLAAPMAVGILVMSGILLAWPAYQPSMSRWFRPPALEYVTLALGTVAVIEIGWALLSPTGHDVSWLWLHRNVMLMVALSLMTVLYGVGLSRVLRPSSVTWADCGRRLGPWLGLLACVMLGMVLIQETIFYDGYVAVSRLVAVMLKLDGAADMKAAWPDEPMAAAAIAIIACAIIGLIGAGLCFAVLPGRDPLGLSERGRTAYVYAAEVLLVLLLVHFKLTMPNLFKQGIFIHYWPFVLITIAFVGAGLSEYFRRKQLLVLAEPLERTGVFLPLLPVLAYWVLPSASEYALVWFLAGFLYGFMSIFKRSWRFALLGAVAANMGLWLLLQDSGFYFWKHPQMWVIPLALVVLVAEQLNQDRLKQAQSAGIRYFALIAIYLSSTADMFIAGLGNSWERPLALMVLSVLGVLVGMLLRIRAYLYLGGNFLVLVIATMIWHAGVDQHQTWILWSSGIVLGVAIYALFMYFEKRRQNVLHLVEKLKKWD